jgi:hypothetical protein
LRGKAMFDRIELLRTLDDVDRAEAMLDPKFRTPNPEL